MIGCALSYQESRLVSNPNPLHSGSTLGDGFKLLNIKQSNLYLMSAGGVARSQPLSEYSTLIGVAYG